MALQDFFVEMCMMDRNSVSDGMGGVVPNYTEGAHFMAGITTNQSTQARVAYQQGLKTMYTIVFKPTVTLAYGDRVKRISDGLVFKVTSNARDMTTPAAAALQMSQVTAEVVEP